MSYIRDIVSLTGVGLIVYGSYSAWPPLGIMLAGVGLIGWAAASYYTDQHKGTR